MRKVKQIDSEHGVFEIHDEEEEHYATESDIRKVNFTEAKTAQSLSARLVRMRERIDDDVGLLETISPELRACLGRIEVLSNIEGGKRLQQIIDKRLHQALSAANREIIRLDVKSDKIARRKIPVVVRAMEYEAPLPDEGSLFSEYEKKKKRFERDEKEAVKNSERDAKVSSGII